MPEPSVTEVDVPVDTDEPADPISIPVMNIGIQEPQVNGVGRLVSLMTITQNLTGVACDMNSTDCKKHVIVVVNSGIADLSSMFVRIEESANGTNGWAIIKRFSKIGSRRVSFEPITRKERYLRAVIELETASGGVPPVVEVAVVIIF